MPISIPDGKHIDISLRSLPADYHMASMQMSTDHYNIGYTISGDRLTITPLQSYENHTGDVAMSPPYMYHRTVSLSNNEYVSYLIKFTPDFIAPFFDLIGKNIFDELYEQKVCHFTLETQQKIERMFQEMLFEFQKDTEYKEVILQGMLFRLLTTIWEDRLQGGAVSFPSPLSEPIIHAIYHIEKNFAQKITLESIARKQGFSTAYFSRLFRAQLGMTFSKYLNNTRISHAQTLLARTDKSIMDIALETGFCHGDYFATQFKNKIGMTPSEFRLKTKTAPPF